MIDSKSALTIKYDSSGVFTDYTNKAVNYARDSFIITLDSVTDYLYIGFKKPITAFYIDILNTSYTEANLELDYFDGTDYYPVDGLADDTLGLSRSGFISFDREQESHAKSSVDSNTMYWYRLRVDETRTDLEVSGINLIFVDDFELSKEVSIINDEGFRSGEASHIKIHESVRDDILQAFGKQDYYKINSLGQKEDINIWDLHDLAEVKVAAKYKALSKIYYNVSDQAGDVYDTKSKHYQNLYEKNINLARLSLDVNDNGKVEASENKPQLKVSRLTR